MRKLFFILFFLNSIFGISAPQPDNLQKLIKNAENGDAEAQMILSDCYLRGKGVPKDLDRAVFWLKKSAEQECSEAQIGLGLLYRKGEILPKDTSLSSFWYRKGFEGFQKAAIRGNAKAQYNLARCFEIGKAIPKDDAKALYWYRKAAEQEYKEALIKMGDIYYYGFGVPRDYSQAVLWYKKAIEKGDTIAGEMIREIVQQNENYNKGLVCYHSGDFTNAVRYFLSAAEVGHLMAQYYLGQCYENGQGVTENIDLAISWYEIAAEKGLPEGQNALGLLYQLIDKEKAIYWYREAAKQGHEEAKQSLQLLYEEK